MNIVQPLLFTGNIPAVVEPEDLFHARDVCFCKDLPGVAVDRSLLLLPLALRQVEVLEEFPEADDMNQLVCNYIENKRARVQVGVSGQAGDDGIVLKADPVEIKKLFRAVPHRRAGLHSARAGQRGR